ncbi:hypothetical protein [Longitalea arenae]|uniref:hypothetical protein n=1 Tax=Longitalea arenae TaxID=2812558 RepID=UPI0019680B03|nr:hypothetical protein [Longitalea arenae]
MKAHDYFPAKQSISRQIKTISGEKGIIAEKLALDPGKKEISPPVNGQWSMVNSELQSASAYRMEANSFREYIFRI